MVKIITVGALKELMNLEDNLQIIDVRNDDEVANGMIPGAIHIQKDTVPNRLNEIDKSRTVYINCGSGIRSAVVAEFLNANGYNTYSLDGGYQSWKNGGGRPLFS